MFAPASKCFKTGMNLGFSEEHVNARI